MVSVRSSVRDTQGRSRVPELGPLGSMRGASSNGRPYREHSYGRTEKTREKTAFRPPTARRQRGPDFVNYRSHSAAQLDARACGSALLLAAFDLVLHGLDNREYADAHALPQKENPKRI